MLNCLGNHIYWATYPTTRDGQEFGVDQGRWDCLCMKQDIGGSRWVVCFCFFFPFELLITFCAGTTSQQRRWRKKPMK